MDLILSYSSRPDIADDLAMSLHKLEQASNAERPTVRRSVTTEQPPSAQRVNSRLTNEDIRQLVAAFKSGTPKRLLRQHRTNGNV